MLDRQAFLLLLGGITILICFPCVLTKDWNIIEEISYSSNCEYPFFANGKQHYGCIPHWRIKGWNICYQPNGKDWNWCYEFIIKKYYETSYIKKLEDTKWTNNQNKTIQCNSKGCYFLFNEFVNSEECKIRCKARRMNPIKITNDNENKFFTNMLKANDFARINIDGNDRHEEGRWVNQNGDPLTYTNFAAGEPEADVANKDCVHLSNDGLWYAHDCKREIRCGCHKKEPTPCNPNRCGSNARCVVIDAKNYDCQCFKGYEKDENFQCIEAKTCFNSDVSCHFGAECRKDALGKYKCLCKKNFVASGPEKCVYKYDCKENQINGVKCDQKFGKCVNTNRGHECKCNPGFVGNGEICLFDKDCKYNDQVKCGINEECQPTNRGNECKCKDGYSKINGKCVHKDDCKANSLDCDKFEVCEKRTLSYPTCVCKPDFIRVNDKCTYKKDCKAGLDKCGAFQKCKKVVEGYHECVCDDDFTLKENRCIHKKDCLFGPDDAKCGEHEDCLPQDEGYNKCKCKFGYSIFGADKKCTLQNDCKIRKLTCENGKKCLPFDKGHKCQCPAEHIMHEGKCTHTEDCSSTLKVCSKFEKCGSNNRCVCKDGFILNKNGVCVYKNDCKLTDTKCKQKTEDCVATTLGHECLCKENYEKVQGVCHHQKDCSTRSSCGKFSSCRNSNFHYPTCQCDPGFVKRTIDGKDQCVYEKDCKQLFLTCRKGHTCQQTERGHECKCPEDHDLINGQCWHKLDCRVRKSCTARQECKPSAKDNGAYRCQCQTNFVWSVEKNVCVYKNDCEHFKSKACQSPYVCTETEVGNECACPEDTVEKNGKCYDKNDCNIDASKCKKDGSEVCLPAYSDCQCAKGYKRMDNADGTDDGDCVPETDCRLVENKCKNGKECQSDLSSDLYKCKCPINFKFNEKTQSCIHKSDCRQTGNTCDKNEQCVSVGQKKDFFQCNCVKDFVEKDGRCVYHGDCKVFEKLGCTHGKKCLKSARGHECNCEMDYVFKNNKCTHKQDCNLNPSKCTGNTECRPEFMQCQCKKNFVHDKNGKCVYEDPENCVYAKKCSANQNCVNVGGGKMRCKCKPGLFEINRKCYSRDSCSTLLSCANNGQCFASSGSMTPTCQCKKGFACKQNEGQCLDKMNCREFPVKCDKNAACVRNSSRKYRCTCLPGFRGDGIIGCSKRN